MIPHNYFIEKLLIHNLYHLEIFASKLFSNDAIFRSRFLISVDMAAHPIEIDAHTIKVITQRIKVNVWPVTIPPESLIGLSVSKPSKPADLSIATRRASGSFVGF